MNDNRVVDLEDGDDDLVVQEYHSDEEAGKLSDDESDDDDDNEHVTKVYIRHIRDLKMCTLNLKLVLKLRFLQFQSHHSCF